MALAPERYRAVDTELLRIQQFLQILAQEIQETMPPPDNRGATWVAALEADSVIGHLRHRLASVQEKQHSRKS